LCFAISIETMLAYSCSPFEWKGIALRRKKRCVFGA
jgi:hypothetical protein